MKEKVIAYAIQVFGNNHEIAMKWMKAFNPDLGAKPEELIETESGCDMVLNSLFRIEDGLY